MNAPYRFVIQENSRSGTALSQIFARDGDTGDARNLQLDIIDDVENYFRIEEFRMEDGIASAMIVTTDNRIDRESERILANGGIYRFALKVKRLIH